MTIQTFWNILLKTLGLILLFKFLIAFQEIVIMYQQASKFQSPEAGNYLLIWLFTIFIYVVCIYVMLFKSAFLQNLLKLNSSTEDERININLSGASILKIASIVIGALLILESISTLVRNTALFIQMSQFNNQPNVSITLVSNIVMIVIGFLLISRSASLARYFHSESEEH